MKFKIRTVGQVVFISFCVGVILFLFSGTDSKENGVNSWRELSNNRFAYNICAIPHQKRSDNSQSSFLPSAHIAFLPERRSEHCHLPSSGMKSWQLDDVKKEVFIPGQTHVCQKLFLGHDLDDGDRHWIEATNQIKDESILDLLANTGSCEWIREKFLGKFYVTDEERHFPIAYAINIDREPHQVLHFLASIYRPHNIYCVHFDLKCRRSFKQIFFNLAACLHNVVVPRKVEDVYRGWYTLVDAHKSCFSDLMLARDRYPWRYVITLCGKELPMRTNAEIVSLLRPLNGTSSIQMVGRDGLDMYKFKWKWSLNKFTGWITKKDERLDPIPFGLKVYKSWAYVALSFQFVEYYLCSDVGIVLREFMKDVKIPEENIYAMLYMKPDVPGGYRDKDKDKVFPIMSCIWLDGDSSGLLMKYKILLSSKKYCSGSNVHNVCVLAARDLNKLSYRPQITGYQDIKTYIRTNGKVSHYDGADRGPLFHNKYRLTSDRVVVECMERELTRRNKMEYERECS